MTMHRASLTLRIEREIVDPQGGTERVSLAAVFGSGAPGPGAEPSMEELREALIRLRTDLEGTLVGERRPGPAPRSLQELVETYRPRQQELVGLLEAEGEITGPEANLLLAYLAQGERPPVAGTPEAPGIPPPTDRPIAALPLENDRTPSTARPVAQLLELYRIETLKQAGAVRARRQISFEEYMALKRHFSAASAGAAAPGSGGADPGSDAHAADRR